MSRTITPEERIYMARHACTEHGISLEEVGSFLAFEPNSWVRAVGDGYRFPLQLHRIVAAHFPRLAETVLANAVNESVTPPSPHRASVAKYNRDAEAKV